MSFGLKRNKEKVIAILDIGSSSVGGAIVSFEDGHLPKILFSVREDMVFQKTFSIKRFFTAMTSALNKVLIQMEKSNLGAPRDFICVLASPWYESITKTVEIKKESDFIVTPTIVDALLKKEVEKIGIHINKKNDGESSVIDVEIIQTKLNGYETNNPYDKKTSSLEVSFFIALGLDKILSNIKENIQRTFNSSNISFHAFPFVAFIVIRDIFTDRNNFFFLDITGEITDLSFIKNDVWKGTSSFPFGKNFIIRRLSSHLNTVPEEVISLLNTKNENIGDKEIQENLSNILKVPMKEWTDALISSISDVTGDDSVPGTIFFTADDEISGCFQEVLEREKFERLTTPDKNFNVRYLDAKILEHFCSFEADKYNEGSERKDTFIMIDTIFADRYKKRF